MRLPKVVAAGPPGGFCQFDQCPGVIAVDDTRIKLNAGALQQRFATLLHKIALRWLKASAGRAVGQPVKTPP